MRRASILATLAGLALAGGLGAAPATAAPERSRLENGLEVWVEPRPGAGSVSVRLLVAAGSGAEGDLPAGTAHVAEHVLFFQDLEPAHDAAVRGLERRGAYLNAFTMLDATYAVVDTAPADLGAALELLASCVRLPALSPETVAHHREVVLRELEENPEDEAYLALREALYGHHPVARPEGGTPEGVSEIRGRDIEEFVGRFYRPPGIVLIVTGDTTAAAVDAAARAAFEPAPWPASTANERPYSRYAPPPAPPTSTLVPDATASDRLLAGFLTPGAAEGDPLPFWVLRELLEMRLWKRLRLERAATYAPWVELVLNREEGMVHADLVTPPALWPTVRDVVTDELDRFTSGAVTDGELEEARDRAAARTEREHHDPAALADYLVWAASWGQPAARLLEPGVALASLAPAEIRAAARAWAPRRVATTPAEAPDLPASDVRPVVPTAVWVAGALLCALQIAVLIRLGRVTSRLREPEGGRAERELA